MKKGQAGLVSRNRHAIEAGGSGSGGRWRRRPLRRLASVKSGDDGSGLSESNSFNVGRGADGGSVLDSSSSRVGR